MPLSYKFAYKKSEDDFESLIYFGSKSETPPIKLPLGKASLNYSVLVIVDAADSYLAANISTLNVTVRTSFNLHINPNFCLNLLSLFLSMLLTLLSALVSSCSCPCS